MAVADKYPDLNALKAHVSKRDYRIRRLNRGATITIISPHGGYIEAGTSAIAQAIAGRDYNLFDFQGLDPNNAADLHVTSTRFRDPALNELLALSEGAVSVHCMGNQNKPVIWLGGKNLELKRLIFRALQSKQIEVDPDGPQYRGESPNNVVNMCRHGGVQLEISLELMQQLFKGPMFCHPGQPSTSKLFRRLVSGIRRALAVYQ